MKIVKVGNGRETEVPESWEEGEDMVEHALGAFYDVRGQNSARLSVCARIAYGMFGEHFMAADPTQALLYLLQRICERKGAGLVP